MAKKVTVIKAAKAQKHTQEERRLKVCGYARVSTGSQAQATSYTAQVEYYTEKIESNPLWEFAGVYADEGISGTNVKHGQAKQVCVEAINAVIRNKGLLRVHRQEEKVSPQYRVLERNLQRMKEEQERTETDLMKLLYERAEERYRTLEVRDGEFRTEEIKNILAGKKELETFDENLYRKIIARIWVHGGNMAEVELINGSRVTAGYKD